MPLIMLNHLSKGGPKLVPETGYGITKPLQVPIPLLLAPCCPPLSHKLFFIQEVNIITKRANYLVQMKTQRLLIRENNLVDGLGGSRYRGANLLIQLGDATTPNIGVSVCMFQTTFTEDPKAWTKKR